MDGVINILKPPGMTSFDVVALLRGILGTKKIGHAGTLDPLAVGVLPVCAGKATGAIEFLMEKDKQYRAELTLGIVTDTQDSQGEVLSRKAPQCSDEEIAVSVASFTGIYNQLPPMYSALKVNGKRLYELAREGIEVDRQPRQVEVYSARVLDIDRTGGIRVLMDVHCSKGTYIRTLCADIGERLGCGAYMSFLLRKKAGPFELADAVTLEELGHKRENGTLETVLQDVDKVFGSLPYYRLTEDTEKKFRNGVRIPILAESILQTREHGYSIFPNTGGGPDDFLIRVYGMDGRFAAIGEAKREGRVWLLKVKKFFQQTGSC